MRSQCKFIIITEINGKSLFQIRRTTLQLQTLQLFPFILVVFDMGGALRTAGLPDRAPPDEKSIEYFAFKVLQAEYQRAKEITAAAEEEGIEPCIIPTDDPFYFQRMTTLYRTALLEKDTPIQACKCPSIILYKYSQLDPKEKREFHQAVIEATMQREKIIEKKAALSAKVQDYSQSFGGTAADTKNE